MMAHAVKEKGKAEMRNQWDYEEREAERIAEARKEKSMQNFRTIDASNRVKILETHQEKKTEKERDVVMVQEALRREAEQDKAKEGVKADQNAEVKALSLAQQKIKDRKKIEEKDFENKVVGHMQSKNKENEQREELEAHARKKLLGEMVVNNKGQTLEKVGKKGDALRQKAQERVELDQHIDHVVTLSVEQNHTRKAVLKNNMNELMNQQNDNRIVTKLQGNTKAIEQKAYRQGIED